MIVSMYAPARTRETIKEKSARGRERDAIKCVEYRSITADIRVLDDGFARYIHSARYIILADKLPGTRARLLVTARSAFQYSTGKGG